jgi:hypothetical protein
MEDIPVTHSDACAAAVHEFRIPPKALSGVHSYCPVHFDTFHAVLIDVSVHVSVMKSAAYKRPAILSSDASNGKNLTSGNIQSSKKVCVLRLLSALHFLIQQIDYFALCSFRVSTHDRIIFFFKQSFFSQEDVIYARVLLYFRIFTFWMLELSYISVSIRVFISL